MQTTATGGVTLYREAPPVLYNYLIEASDIMKKIALILVIVILMNIPVTANAATPRSVGIMPNLQFENKTANCVVHITGNSMNESIDITVKLWYGNRCVVTWTNSGKGVLHFSNTYDVAYKGEYKLSVDATIGGEKYDTVSVKNSCG